MATYGNFVPRFPEKYVGDVSKIFFRSSWELQVMKWLDSRLAVKRWGSEEVVIPYLSPKDGAVHNYFPDFFMEYVSEDGKNLKEIIEVKPRHESEEKYAKCERSKDALLINEAKWRAAALWCEQHGMRFRVLTEHSIFYQGQKTKKAKK